MKNPHRIPWKQALENAGFSTDLDDDLTKSYLMDSSVTACCDEGCEVEPDGHCSHGCPSLLLAMRLI